MVESYEVFFKRARDTHIEMIKDMGLDNYICIYSHGEIMGTFENTDKGYDDTGDIISKLQNIEIFIYFPPDELEE